MRLKMMTTRRLAFLAMAAVAFSAGIQTALAADKPYTIGNYPVDATAPNAVAAKEKAFAEGRQAAFRSLLKRLVPVTAYKQLSRVKREDAANMLDGVAVRSERNSATQYIATLDFSFYPQPVRDLLRQEGIPMVDVQSPKVVVIPLYVAPPGSQGSLGQAQGSRTWSEVWRGLDLENALTPIRLEAPKAGITADTVRLLKEGDGQTLASVARTYAADYLVLALAEADIGARRLNVTIAGRDAVDAFVLKRSYRLAPDDVSYTAELAAVIALGTLEGRWKAYKETEGAGGYGGSGGPVQLAVEFRSLQQWQDVRREISTLQGAEDIDIGNLTARSADISLRYPGGPDALVEALAARGLQARRTGDGGVLVRPLN